VDIATGLTVIVIVIYCVIGVGALIFICCLYLIIKCCCCAAGAAANGKCDSCSCNCCRRSPSTSAQASSHVQYDNAVMRSSTPSSGYAHFDANSPVSAIQLE
jgi:hypothetical protein